MANVAALRTGLAANLQPLASSFTGLTVSKYMMNNPTPPVVWVRLSPDILVDYHLAFQNGYETWHLMVQAFAGAHDDEDAQAAHDVFLSSTGSLSVKAAIESDLTLGGACNGLEVVEIRGYTEFSRPDGATLLGSEWDVEIHA